MNDPLNDTRRAAYERLKEIKRQITQKEGELTSLWAEHSRVEKLIEDLQGTTAPTVPETTVPGMPPIPADALGDALLKAKYKSKLFTPTAPEVNSPESVAPDPYFANLPPIPPVPHQETIPHEEMRMEIDFGRWLARIGVVFALITLISFSAMLYTELGPVAKLFILTIVSVGMFWGGVELERRDPAVVVFARTLAGGGLACLYFTLYGASNLEQLRVIDSPILGGLLLLAWSAFVLCLGEQKKSELLSFFSIALAYFSSAINPNSDFMLFSNLLLAATSVVLLIRNSWLGLSYFCLVTTYVGLLWSFAGYSDWGVFHAPEVSFWACVGYLAGAWIIHCAGLFSGSPSLSEERRIAYQFLNNGGLVGMMLLSAMQSGFGHYGEILCALGFLNLTMAAATGSLLPSRERLDQWFMFQGLGLITAAIVEHYTGQTRGLLLVIETVFLAAAAAYSGNLLMRLLCLVVSCLALGFLLFEVDAHPNANGLLFSGLVAMLINGYIARWNSKTEQPTVPSAVYVVLGSIYFCIGSLMHSEEAAQLANSGMLLAVVGSALFIGGRFTTFSELLFGGPILLICSGLTVINPNHDHNSLLAKGIVAGIMAATSIAWQNSGRAGQLRVHLVTVFAIMTTLTAFWGFHPSTDKAGEMISMSLLSAGFFLFGMLLKVPPFAIAGQLLLGQGCVLFLSEDASNWPWWTGIVPICVLLGTGWLGEEWINRAIQQVKRKLDLENLRGASVLYRVIATCLFTRLLYVNLPPYEMIPATLGLGLFLVILGEAVAVLDVAAICAVAANLIGGFLFFGKMDEYGNLWDIACLFLVVAQVLILKTSRVTKPVCLIGINFVASVCATAYVIDCCSNQGIERVIPIFCIGAVLFTAIGLWFRLLQPLICGQGLLFFGVVTFLSRVEPFSMMMTLSTMSTWLSAFAIGWLIHPRFVLIKDLYEANGRVWAKDLAYATYVYRGLGALLLAIWVTHAFPNDLVCLTLMALGVGVTMWNIFAENNFGMRCGLGLGFIGVVFYVAHRVQFDGAVEILDGLGFACLLFQSTIFRMLAGDLVQKEERCTFVMFGSICGWLFVANAFPWPHYATMVWALYAVLITLLGFIGNERLLRLSGLGLLAIAIVRVGLHDFWDFPGVLKVMTFLALTMGCMGLSYLYHRFGNQMKEWI